MGRAICTHVEVSRLKKALDLFLLKKPRQQPQESTTKRKKTVHPHAPCLPFGRFCVVPATGECRGRTSECAEKVTPTAVGTNPRLCCSRVDTSLSPIHSAACSVRISKCEDTHSLACLLIRFPSPCLSTRAMPVSLFVYAPFLLAHYTLDPFLGWAIRQVVGGRWVWRSDHIIGIPQDPFELCASVRFCTSLRGRWHDPALS